MAAPAKVDLTRPVKSQAASGVSPADAEQAAAEAAIKALHEQVMANEAAKFAADQAADQAAADQLAADEAAQVAADTAAAEAAALAAAQVSLTDTKIVRAIHTVGLAGGKLKIPGDEFELPSGTADELEALGIVAFLEEVEAEEAFAAKKAARKTK